MRIVNYPPPANIYDRAVKEFGVNFEGGTIFTYGEDVHTAHPLTPDLILHESIHVKQQALYPGGPDAWWEEYFANPEFRLAQEVEAYKTQFQFICKTNGIKAKQQRWEVARVLANQLASPMYGSPVGLLQAINMIR